MNMNYKNDIDKILSHRYDNGFDYFTNNDMNLIKGAPFTTLESCLYLLELGVPTDNEVLGKITELIFSTWKEDGRFKLSPHGAIYPCQTARALNTLCYLNQYNDSRIKKTFEYFYNTQESDGGWKCNKYSFGKGEETNYSTPFTTLLVLDSLRYSELFYNIEFVNKAVEFLLNHWEIKKPISPCHFGIGKLFNQIEYPFRGYNLFYYVYILSFYDYAKNDKRFLEAFNTLASKTIDNNIVVERIVPKLAKLDFCKKNEVSILATKRYHEILNNTKKETFS